MLSAATVTILAAIAIGAVLLLLAAKQTTRMLRLRREMPFERVWRLLRALIVLFAAGYVATMVVVYLGEAELLATLTGLIFLGGATFVYLVVRISQMSLARLLEQSLARSYVVNLLDALRDVVLVVDARGVIITGNRQACALTGFTAEELTGRLLSDLLTVLPESTNVAAGSRLREQDMFLKGGKRIPVVSFFAAARGPDGVSAATICVLSDRRDARRNERQLEQAVLVAESALRARNQVSAILVDEGLPPITQLRNLTEGLAAEALTGPQMASVRAIDDGLDGLERVLQGLLERVHGVDTLGQAAHIVEPAVVLVRVCEALRPVAAAVRLRWHVDPGVPVQYHGRESIVYEVLTHLGRYLLSVGHPEELDFAVERVPGQDDRLLFTATASAEHDTSAAASMSASRGPDSHLALASARLLVNATGGKLWQTDHDAANRIAFTVPIERPVAADANSKQLTAAAGQTPLMWLAATASRYQAAAHGPEDGKGTVLVVDDSPQTREALVHHLTRWGYTTEVAETGADCLEAVRKTRFDVILLDMLLPDINGLEVLAALREEKLAGDLAVIMISAIEETSSIAACFEQGAQDYITKPINPTVLRARLAGIYEKKRLGDQREQQMARLATEMRRSDALLRVILPDPIAEELLLNNSVAARRHDDVAVLFTDIVGFTAYCETHPAEDVLMQLQALFTTIEALCERHKVLKIKTVGDAMMACAGLLEPEAAPVARCVDLGLAILEAVRHHPAGWTLRVGVHFGPVVSGLVGQRQFLYDIWGDTVNTAQRVEQHGVVGKVCVSPTARAKLSARFRTPSIGTVDIKGKGPMELFVAEVAGSSRRLAAVVPDAPSPAAPA